MNLKINESDCLEMQYQLLNGMYFDNKNNLKDYLLCYSEIMDDYFWNIAYIKTKLDDNVLNDLKDDFRKINRNPSIYIGIDNENYVHNKSFLEANNYKLNNTDVYMILKNANKYEISADIKIVETEKEYNDFMQVLESAFGGEKTEENSYAGSITDCYYRAIKNTINSDKFHHIILYDNEIPISVATLNYIDGLAGINNVGTAQEYWNKGYGKQLMTYVVNKFEELGGGTLTLSTEHKSKNELFYEKLGFNSKYVMEQYM